MTVEAVVTEYRERYAEWWGLEDGTLLAVDDPNGKHFVRIDGETREA